MSHFTFSTVIVLPLLLISITSCKQENSRSAEAFVSSSNASAADQSVQRKELLATLKSEDFENTIVLMNRIKRMTYQGELIQILQRIWLHDFSSFESINDRFVSHPRIRIEIADILLQANNNGQYGLSPNDYLDYSRTHARDSDVAVARQAILVLGIARDKIDLALLTSIFHEENEATSIAAAWSILRICEVTESDIDRLGESIKSKDMKLKFARIRQDIQILRLQTCPQ